ncbi:xaa-Arg dipeptidase-like isoform X2 [Apostichopus japonicus]|uniref:xaa-Arg dipeptidase-like isoform X2 n=1 Tax=Stichopus japonicus TaxID=307972 RepID=UPI003AB46130
MEAVAVDKIDSSSERLNTLSQELWNNPELCFEEHHAHEILTTFLEKEGFQVQKQYILKTAFKASFGNDDGPQIALMAEYDALPDIGHACGHNLIAEAAIGAALGVKAALEQMKQPRGRVIVFGTPAEEGGAGKVTMLEGGAFMGLDVAMMVHPANENANVPGFFARRKARYHFHGKAAHAAMSPWMGRNALDAAVQCYTGISAQRQQFRPDVRVHGIFTKGGSRPNIIPEEAELLYYIRASKTVELESVVKKCENCAKGAAIAADCTVDIKYESFYAEVLSNLQLADLFQKNCESLGMDFSKDDKIVKSLGGSTDMGNVSFVVPSIHPMYAINTDAPNHSREFTTAAGSPGAQKSTLIQAKAMALTALQLLLPGGDALLKNIKAEFAEVPPNPYVTGQKSFENTS